MPRENACRDARLSTIDAVREPEEEALDLSGTDVGVELTKG